MTQDNDIWITQDVADYLRCSLPHVRKLIAEQGLPCMRLGRLLRFERESVVRWKAEQSARRGAA